MRSWPDVSDRDNKAMPAHLIHIGFPKCASTFLQHWFADHPQIAYEEGLFGGVHSAYELIADVLAPTDAIVCRVTSAEQLSDPRARATFSEAQVTPLALRHAWMEKVCLELAALFPNARILMITRNQADLAVSGYSQLVKMGGHIRDTDFEKILGHGLRHIHPFDFDLVLSVYRAHFAGRVLALPFEMLVADRQAFLDTIADFMGVDRRDVAVGRVNESLDAEELYWYPRISSLLRRAPTERFRRKLVAMHCRLIRIGAWRPLLNCLKWAFGAKGTGLSLPPAVRERLVIDCEELLKLEHYAPYRALYRGSAGRSASSPLR